MKYQYIQKLKLPDAPGIYIFRDRRRRPIYIGRATSLKDRVRSYFSNDLIDARGPRLVDMVTKASSLSSQATASVLEAILLESVLIKRYQPFYNVEERDDKSNQYVVITDEPWPRVFLVRARDYDQAESNGVPGSLGFKVRRRFGPFVESGTIKEALKILRKLFPFRDRKANDSRHEAFYRAINQSPRGNELPAGAPEYIEARRQYQRTIRYISLFFEGRSQRVREMIERDMRRQARNLEFEQAARSRKLLYALNHINDISLIKRGGRQAEDSRWRIEAYDVAHLAGTHVVGSMTVSTNGEAVPAEYRKFKLSRDANDDLAALAEILSRRLNHSEWQYPDLIVVDGNHNQLRTAEAVLKSRRISIPIVAVTKDERHRAARLIGSAAIVEKYRDEIIAVNAEAHRFAVAYHRQRRSMR